MPERIPDPKPLDVPDVKVDTLQANDIPAWDAQEQLASAEKQAEFTAYAREVFKRFEDGISKDKSEYGGNPRWSAFYQECAQRINEYSRATPDQQTPTNPEMMQLMLSSVTSLDKALRRYAIERGSNRLEKKAKEQVPPKEDDLAQIEKFDWRIESKQVFKRFGDLRQEMANAGLSEKEEGVAKLFVDKAFQYFDIYSDYVDAANNVVKDEAMARVIVWELQKLIAAFEPAVRKEIQDKLAKDTAKEGIPATPVGFDFGASLKSLQNSVTGTVTDKIGAAAMEATKNAPIPSVDIRELVLKYGGEQEMPKFTKEQLEAALFMKAHLKDLGGEKFADESTVHFNRSDIASVAQQARLDLMHNRPAELYEQILQANAKDVEDGKGKPLSEDDKKGLRLMIDHYNGIDYSSMANRRADMAKALATFAEHKEFDSGMRQLASAPGQIAQGEQKLSKGIRFRDRLAILPRNKGRSFIPLRPLHNLIGRKVDEGAAELAQGKKKYFDGLKLKAQFDQAKAMLPGQVEGGIVGQLHDGMDSAGITRQYDRDASVRPNVNKQLLDDFARHANVLGTIGQKDLVLKVWKPSGKRVDSGPALGLNPSTLDFMLDVQNSVEAKKGTPPGMMITVKELSQADKDLIAQLEKPEEETKEKVVQAEE